MRASDACRRATANGCFALEIGSVTPPIKPTFTRPDYHRVRRLRPAFSAPFTADRLLTARFARSALRPSRPTSPQPAVLESGHCPGGLTVKEVPHPLPGPGAVLGPLAG